MRELRPLLARRLGVLSRLCRTPIAGVLGLGRREAGQPHATGLVLARRPWIRERHTYRIERLVQAAAPPREAAVSSFPASRLVLNRAEREVKVHTVRERVERPSALLERSTERLIERYHREHSVERLVVRQDRERVRDRETVRTWGTGDDGADGRDGAAGLAQRPGLALRLPFVPSAADRPAEPPTSLEQPRPAVGAQAPPIAVGVEEALSEPALALLTEHVLRRIERRAIAQRERLGIA